MPVETLVFNLTGGGSGGGGGSGTNGIQQFPIVPNSEYATGFAIVTLLSASWLLDWWPLTETAYDGLTPQLDLLTAGTSGLLTSRGASPIPLWVPAVQPGGNLSLLIPGNAPGPRSSQSYSAGLQTTALTSAGPPVPATPTYVATGRPLLACVSQDGTAQPGVAASLTAASGVTLPFVVTTGTNDRFLWTGTDPVLGGGAATSLIFTVAQNLSGYSGPNLVLAILGALNAGVTPFSDFAGVSISGGNVLTITDNGGGAAGNGNMFGVFPGRDITAGLGFTPPGLLEGGAGGDPGSSVGATTICLMIGTT